MPLQKPDYCKPCVGYLWGHCKGYSRVTGSARVPVLFVGESSGAAEERQGEPFVGPAGQVFEKALASSGLDRDDYSISNLLRCRPPGNELKGAPYERAALDHCRKYLDDTVAERQPKIIVALGELPLRELSASHSSQSERGYVLPSIYEGVNVIGTFHPSRILRGDWHLFGVLRHDIARAVQYATNGVPPPLETHYELEPTVAAVFAYLGRLSADPELAIAYDIETPGILGQKEPEDWRLKDIVQIQFSSAAGEALVLPWCEPWIDWAKQILALPNVKIGWNSRLSDDITLKAHGITIGGESFDGMAMLSHLQPGFASSKDAHDNEDKGVPARLLNLQSAISFYYPYEPLWKDIMRAALNGGEVSMDDVRYGGARDADLTLRVGLRLISTLKRQGLWEGFYRYKHRLGLVLSEMSERGLPIDREAQFELLQQIEQVELVLERDLQTAIPEQLKPLHPPAGYKRFPKDLREAVKEAGLWVKRCKPTQFPDHARDLGYVVLPFDDGDERLCKRLPFNPRSSDQILTYIQHMIDTVGAPYFIPLHIDTKKPTTNKAGITALLAVTGDQVLVQIEKCKKVSKLKDYCQGKWLPEADGCVHAEFRVGATATGQTTATNPPIQTYPKHFSKDEEWLLPIGKRIKSIIKAPSGHIMVETDMRGFHARMQGFLAEDAAYYRLSTLDAHSFVTAQYVGVADKDSLLAMDDDALLKRLDEIKHQYSHERNYMVKRISFLNQYGGGAEKAATILRIPIMEVQTVLSVMKNTFKPAFQDFPKSVEKLLRQHPRLINAFGLIRWLWDQDANQGVAFLVASPAHCHIQDAVLRLHDRGALRKYNAVDFMHDALWWCPREELADECVAVAKEEFERPSEILVNSLGAFTCKADASRGYNMAEMESV